MNSRLVKMIARGRLPFRGGQWIDTYNQTTSDIAGTILAGINTKNHYFVMVEDKNECKPIVATELQGGVWDSRFRQSKAVYAPNGISPTIIAGDGGGTEIKIIENTQNYIVIPANTSDGEQVMELGGVCDLSYPTSKTRRGRVQDGGKVTPALTRNTESSLYRIEPINDQDGCSRTIKSQYQQTSKANLERDDSFGATVATDGFRIRKLTPREYFRLMGVSDSDIDKIQAAGISKSQQSKLAGNSIVVNCLAAIFRQLFIGNFNKATQTEIF